MRAFTTIILAAIFTGPIVISAQTYPSHNISLIGKLDPNTDTPSVNKYSGCWGWYQASKNREYAISGGSNGTYFVDVTNPANPVLCDFVQAAHEECTWREMKTYQNYCYIVSDYCNPNRFQIVDLKYLPDSVHVIYDSGALFRQAHTVWIDKDKMYCAQVKFPGGYSAMSVFSLANPEQPVLLRRVEEDSLNINEVHDMYVINDTIYASAGWQGLRVLRLTAQNKFEQLGAYTGYAESGYNHSSWLTKDRRHLIFCDELPNELPIHFINVENLSNMQPVKRWRPTGRTTPHNPFILGDHAVVSCYQDGLFIYDLSNPNAISYKGFFDTWPQGGVNTGDYGVSAYRGNWGAYPFLPSGVIIANDMMNGVFILDATAAYSSTVTNPVGIDESPLISGLRLLPNPANRRVEVALETAGPWRLVISDIAGREIFSREGTGLFAETIDISELKPGVYTVTGRAGSHRTARKLVIER